MSRISPSVRGSHRPSIMVPLVMMILMFLDLIYRRKSRLIGGGFPLMMTTSDRTNNSSDNRTVVCNQFYSPTGQEYSLTEIEWLKEQSLNDTKTLCDPFFDPSSQQADMSKPVQVFLLLGQSNMVGMGSLWGDQDGTLEYSVTRKHRYHHMYDSASTNWTVRHDVRFVQIMGEDGKILHNEWLQVSHKDVRFGVEQQLGYILGERIDAPVLLLKSCIGNRALGWDLLPPGSKAFYWNEDGRIYAGYGQTPDRWFPNETNPTPVKNWYAGKQWDVDIANSRKILDDLPSYYPLARHKGYEIAGFVFWQGERDRHRSAYAARYEQNLAQFIRQIRMEFRAPKAKFVLSTIGFDGYDMTGYTKQVFEAQMSISDPAKYPEFQNSVQSVDMRASYRGGGYHYNNSADTYQEVGNGLGLALVQLLAPGDKKD